MARAFAILISFVVIATNLAVAQAADQAQCEAAWLKADVNKDGQLQPEEVANLAPADTGDDAVVTMSEAEFLDACKKGMFDSIFAPEQ